MLITFAGLVRKFAIHILPHWCGLKLICWCKLFDRDIQLPLCSIFLTESSERGDGVEERDRNFKEHFRVV